jgi:pimeloyl-ACP methyl ester carboxylesterase
VSVSPTAGPASQRGAARSGGTTFPASFYAGGQYIREADGTRTLVDQVYVAYYPTAVSAGLAPLVLIHGAAQTGAGFETTPDGRPGFAELLCAAGHPVYVVDQPARGRSRYHADRHGPLTHYSAEMMERAFTAPRAFGLWPQASLHTQWPGSGRIGDPVFDQFYASQVGHVADYTVAEPLMRAAGAALLERTGPAVLVTHSQSGAFGWHIADTRPELVRAVVAIEPKGPPFFETRENGTAAPPRPWGITATPLTYDPPVPDGDLGGLSREHREGGWQQSRPTRQLPRLAGIPVLLVTGEASYHAVYDQHTVRFLREAGVTVDHLALASIGIRGNGHLMPMELNNDQIASAISRWTAEL